MGLRKNSNTMKILMLGWELPPYHVGGMGVVCYQLCKALNKKDIDIEFIVPYHADHRIDFMEVTSGLPFAADTMRSAGGIYDSFGFGDTSKSDSPSLQHQMSAYSDAVVKLVEEKEFDIIHAHDWLTFRAAIAAKQRTGLPLIAHIHATEFDRSGGSFGNPLVRDIEYYGLRIADKIVAVSQATKDTIVASYDIDPDKIDVVHNSLEIAPDVRYEKDSLYPYLQFMKQNGYKVVVNAGRLTIQKGLTFYLEMAKEVIAKDPKVLFVIAGGGELYHELIMRAADLGISKNVLFTGYLNGTGKAWRDIFRVADIFVMPSVSEPFGVAPLEAIAYGTTALVSKQSGVSEAFRNLLKVDYWNTREMANQVLTVIQNESIRTELCKNATQEFNRLDWNGPAQKIKELYTRHRERVLV